MIVNSPLSDAYLYFRTVATSGGMNTTLNLHAPQTGQFAGLLIHLPYKDNDTSIVDFNTGSNVHLTGTIMAP